MITVAAGKTAMAGANFTVNVTANAANFNHGSTIRLKTRGLLSHTGGGSAFRVGQTANAGPLTNSFAFTGVPRV